VVQGDVSPPDFRPRGQSCKSLATFWHNDAIAGFTSQSLGLSAYACKTGSSAAIKLAPRMHRNLSSRAQKSKKNFLVIAPPFYWKGDTPPHTLSVPLVPRSLRLPWFVPLIFKPWIRPREQVCHIISCEEWCLILRDCETCALCCCLYVVDTVSSIAVDMLYISQLLSSVSAHCT